MIIDIKDRVPTNAGRVVMLPVSGKANTYDMTRADAPSVEGTLMNRALLMKLQGFEASTTTFNADGSITEVGTTGTLDTLFNSDGSITERFTGLDGAMIRRTTVFNADGSIAITVG